MGKFYLRMQHMTLYKTSTIHIQFRLTKTKTISHIHVHRYVVMRTFGSQMLRNSLVFFRSFHFGIFDTFHFSFFNAFDALSFFDAFVDFPFVSCAFFLR